MSEEIKETKGVAIPLWWRSADHLPTIYANHAYITHGGSEFYLIFGEAMRPLILERELEQGKELPDHVEIKPVAKLAISPDAMVSIAKAIADNVGEFKQKLEESKADERE